MMYQYDIKCDCGIIIKYSCQYKLNKSEIYVLLENHYLNKSHQKNLRKEKIKKINQLINEN